jgi:hypothetical protein
MHLHQGLNQRPVFRTFWAMESYGKFFHTTVITPVFCMFACI